MEDSRALSVRQTALPPGAMDCQPLATILGSPPSPPQYTISASGFPVDNPTQRQTQVEASKAKTDSWMGAGPEEKQGLLSAQPVLASSFLPLVL